MAKKKAEESVALEVAPLKLKRLKILIRGTAPYCQNRFSNKAREKMIEDQEKGSAGKSSKKRQPKNFDECYENALHVADDGWYGMPAPGLRAAMISACRATGTVMTRAKLAVRVLAEGFDRVDKMPLFKITKGSPYREDSPVRNQTGVIDIRPRPVWPVGWEAEPVVQFDADMLTRDDVVNLVRRVGMQVGLGEGRPDSKKSSGIDWGLFDVIEVTEFDVENV